MEYYRPAWVQKIAHMTDYNVDFVLVDEINAKWVKGQSKLSGELEKLSDKELVSKLVGMGIMTPINSTPVVNAKPTVEPTSKPPEKLSGNTIKQNTSPKCAGYNERLNPSEEDGKYPSDGSNKTEEIYKEYIQNIHTEIGLPENVEKSNLNQFNIFKNYEGIDFFSTGIGYVFITRPDLNLFPGDTKLTKETNRYHINVLDPFIRHLNGTSIGKEILTSLTQNQSFDKNFNIPSGFIPSITNHCKSFSPKDVQLDVLETQENMLGTRIVYGETTNKSISVDNFDLLFNELDSGFFIMLHKCWIEYINNVRRGIFLAKKENILSRVLDYASSLYYFLLGEDGESIVYWCKLTGVLPTTINYSSFDWIMGETKLREINVNYTYSLKEDMGISIFKDFNLSSLQFSDPNIADDKLNKYLDEISDPKKSGDKFILEKRKSDNWGNIPLVVYSKETEKPRLIFLSEKGDQSDTYIKLFINNRDKNQNKFTTKQLSEITKSSIDLSKSSYKPINKPNVQLNQNGLILIK